MNVIQTGDFNKFATENPHDGMKAVLEYGLQLADTKWKPLVDHKDYPDIKHDWLRATLAWCLENKAREVISTFGESTTISALPTFDRFSFGMIRSILPQLVAVDLVSVQPMAGPTGVVFYLDYKYGTSKGKITAGQKMFETTNAYYASETIDEESIGNSGAGQTKAYQGILSWTPVKAGSISITTTDASAATITVTDDGAGNLKEGSTTVGSISYNSGAYDFEFVTTPGVSKAVNATYRYNLEANANVPEVDLILQSSSVVAQTTALRTRWSAEAETDMRMVYGLIADAELSAAVSHELRFEIDQQITLHINNIATLASAAPYSYSAWNRRTPTGVSWDSHKKSIIDHIVNVDSVIYQETNRATGNFIVCGQNVGNIIQTLTSEGFKDEGFVQAKGVYRIGTLKRWAIYIDPAYGVNDFVVGYRGDTTLEAGIMWLPYILLQQTDPITLDDRVTRKGMSSRYATKTIRSNFYVKSSIVDQAYS